MDEIFSATSPTQLTYEGTCDYLLVYRLLELKLTFSDPSDPEVVVDYALGLLAERECDQDDHRVNRKK